MTVMMITVIQMRFLRPHVMSTAVQDFFRSAKLIFRRVPKSVAKRDYQRHHVCPSVCPHERSRIPPMNFLSWKYVLEILLKYVNIFQFWLKLHKNNRHFTSWVSNPRPDGLHYADSDYVCKLCLYYTKSHNNYTTFCDFSTRGLRNIPQ